VSETDPAAGRPETVPPTKTAGGVRHVESIDIHGDAVDKGFEFPEGDAPVEAATARYSQYAVSPAAFVRV
jgi:hypothetical protein